MKNTLWIALLLVVVALLMSLLLKQRNIPTQQASNKQPAIVKQNMTTNTAKTTLTQPQKTQIDKEPRQLKMSPAVAVITGMDNDRKDYRARTAAMKQLTRKLTDNDVKALMSFMDAPLSEEKTLKPLELNAVKNDVLDTLLRQDSIPTGLGRQVVAMYRNNGHDDVWRDYCVQYMGACYEAQSARRMEQGAGSKAHGAGSKEQGAGSKEQGVREENLSVAGKSTNQVAELEAIKDVYWDAIKEKDKTIAGTALIGMEALSRTHPEFDREKIGASAELLALDDACGEAAKITALRICGGMGRTNVLATSRILAQTADTIPLRLAAMATVADLGDKSDLELLQSLSVSSEKRVSSLASNVLIKLTKRVGTDQ